MVHLKMIIVIVSLLLAGAGAIVGLLSILDKKGKIIWGTITGILWFALLFLSVFLTLCENDDNKNRDAVVVKTTEGIIKINRSMAYVADKIDSSIKVDNTKTVMLSSSGKEEKPLLQTFYDRNGYSSPTIEKTDSGVFFKLILSTIDEHRAENIKFRWTNVVWGNKKYQTNGYTPWGKARTVLYKSEKQEQTLAFFREINSFKLPRRTYFVLEVSYTNDSNVPQKIFRGIYPISQKYLGGLVPSIDAVEENRICEFLEKPHEKTNFFYWDQSNE
jgi:hypothetical protein